MLRPFMFSDTTVYMKALDDCLVVSPEILRGLLRELKCQMYLYTLKLLSAHVTESMGAQLASE